MEERQEAAVGQEEGAVFAGAGEKGAPQSAQANARFAAMRRDKERAEAQLKSLQRDLSDREGLLEEARALRSFRDRTLLERDLAAIREEHPEAAQTIGELPEEFLRIMATGQVDAVTGWEIMLAAQNRRRAVAPMAPGELGQAGGEKDFYSPEEVDRLKKEDFERDPQLLKVVERSMTKWR